MKLCGAYREYQSAGIGCVLFEGHEGDHTGEALDLAEPEEKMFGLENIERATEWLKVDPARRVVFQYAPAPPLFEPALGPNFCVYFIEPGETEKTCLAGSGPTLVDALAAALRRLAGR